MPKLTRMRFKVGLRCRSAVAALLGAAAVVTFGTGSSPAADVDGFAGSWLESALQAQYDLGSDVPFKNAPLVGTHNSFNSTEEMGPGLSLLEINQRRDLTDQLDFGVRSLELDLHRDPNGDGSDDRPVVCHTLPREGCTVVRDLRPFLAEIAAWLREGENSEQVLLLYLEDDLDDLPLHDSAAAIIDDELGELIYEPQGSGCQEVPDELTRDQVREADRQIVVVSGCGKGAAWRSLAFSWERHLESRPKGFEDFPGCGPDYGRREYRANLVRYYEDSTRTTGLGGADDGFGSENTAAMARCGVDLFGFDRLEPLDGRLQATVWSWASEEPRSGRCAVIRTGSKLPFGRWISADCGTLTARPVCRDGRRWSVGPDRLDRRKAARYCEREGAQLAVPRTGYENQLVRLAMEEAETRSALLGYRLRGGEWVPLDVR